MPFTHLTHASLADKLEALRKRNIEHSQLFKEETLLRQKYLAEHSTAIFAYKCMDGRVHLPVITKIPLGIIQPFRSLGGRFDLGWPYLSDYVKNLVRQRVNEGRDCLFIVTYHFSKGSEKRGCAGFNFDTNAAYNFTRDFREQIVEIFGERNSVVYPIIVGLETDDDALVFHNNDKKIDLRECLDMSQISLVESFRYLYPDMPAVILKDLMPLIFGNLQHIKEVLETKREIIDMEHKEWIVALGKGFDWLHAPNTALIVGPWSPSWQSDDLYKAFSIVNSNIESGRISDDGFVLLVSSVWEESPDDGFALEKVKFFSRCAMNLLNKEFPQIVSKVHLLPVITNEKTKLFEDVTAKVSLR